MAGFGLQWQHDRACWLTKHVYKELAKRKLSLSAAFARFDKRSTGRLTSASLLRGLRSIGIAVDTVAYDMLLLAFRFLTKLLDPFLHLPKI